MPKASNAARASAIALKNACPDCDKLDTMAPMEWMNFFKALMDFIQQILPVVLPIFSGAQPPNKPTN